MSGPSKTNDIVTIHETYYTPRNTNKAHNHQVAYTYASGLITQEDHTMGGVLRKRINYTYSGTLVATERTRIYEVDGTTIMPGNDMTDSYVYSGTTVTSINRVVV